MAEEDAARMLAALAARCDDAAMRARRRGRRYYFISYALMIVSVAGSIGAGVMALWSDAVPREWIGTVALLPALCATVALQLRLVEKGNFSYKRYRGYYAFARRVEVAQLRAPSLDTLEACNAEYTELVRTFDDMWAENLNFNFTAPGRVDRA
jgi:hypothetical protein